MCKIAVVVFAALVAIAASAPAPGYLGGYVLPAATSYSSRVDVHSKPIVYTAPLVTKTVVAAAPVVSYAHAAPAVVASYGLGHGYGYGGLSHGYGLGYGGYGHGW